MTKIAPEYPKCTGVDFAFVKYVISRRWNSPVGALDEASDCFKLFNKSRGEREYLDVEEIKKGLDEFLDMPVSEQEVTEFILELDP